MIDFNKVIALTLEGEKWKTIPCFPNYLISNMGRVYGGRYNRIVNGSYNEKGYRIIELYSDKFPKGKKFRICRLVAEAFCKGCTPQMEIHHCNLCSCDDREINLLPVTHEQHIAIHKAIDRLLSELLDMISKYKVTNDESEVAAA